MDSKKTEIREQTESEVFENTYNPFENPKPDEDGVFRSKPVHFDDLGSFTLTASPFRPDPDISHKFKEPYKIEGAFVFPSLTTRREASNVKDQLFAQIHWGNGKNTNMYGELENNKTAFTELNYINVRPVRAIHWEETTMSPQEEKNNLAEIHPEKRDEIILNPLIVEKGDLQSMTLVFLRL